jgi:hypothetical protein
MAKNSTYGGSWGTEVAKLCRDIMSNSGHIDKDDLEILRFLSCKGSYEDKKVGFIEINRCYKTEEPCDCNGLCRENY